MIRTYCFALAVTLVVSSLALSQEKDDLAKVVIPEDAVKRENGVRPLGNVTRKYSYFAEDQLVGERLFYRNGKVADEKVFRDGRLHGIWRQYWPNGRLFAERPYRRGVLDGTVRFLDAKGKTLGESVLENGTGTLREFANSQLRSSDAEIPYVDGKIHGKKHRWGRFGNCKARGVNITTYVEGIMDGWSLLYCGSEGSELLLGAGYFQEGKLHGIYRQLDENGKPAEGYPMYHINGREVTKAQFLTAARTDEILKKTLEFKGLGERRPLKE